MPNKNIHHLTILPDTNKQSSPDDQTVPAGTAIVPTGPAQTPDKTSSSNIDSNKVEHQSKDKEDAKTVPLIQGKFYFSVFSQRKNFLIFRMFFLFLLTKKVSHPKPRNQGHPHYKS